MKPTVEAFIEKWSASGAAERANKDAFLLELCDVLDVPRPNPTMGEPEKDIYVFERDAKFAHEGGSVTVGKVDLFKAGCFVLEAKQGSKLGAKKVGTAKRETPAWNIAMKDAYGQALGYARSFESPVPFLIACDLGYCFDLYAAFNGSYNYRPFPNAQSSRIFLSDLAKHKDLLRQIFLEPHSLDPSKLAAKVTREVATYLADLAKQLEAKGHSQEHVATFLMRCLFTMFAEDIGLLPSEVFTKALRDVWLRDPASFVGGLESLWRTMNEGGHLFGITGKILKFNGGLFAQSSALPLAPAELKLLLSAAECNWAEVEPAIFGTLLERALDPKERHRLGAHYTPRAYVERLVRPTIEEPLRAEWDVVQAQVHCLIAESQDAKTEKSQRDKIKTAVAVAREFHTKLCSLRVLDPACGSGNFLYVTLDLFKRLEGEVLVLLESLGETQTLLHIDSVRVTPAQFLGIEVKRWAKEIAELVLWIGYLQWHFRTYGKHLPVPEPVLQDYKNIECRDAVLAYDRVEPLIDDKGKPVTRWDGTTYKKSPITGKDIPDESAQVPVLRYINPRKAEWPRADFIVGNPPFLGTSRMREALGDGYTEALRKTYAEIPESADLVMFWWHKAAQLVCDGKVQRFGFITTNSLRQTFNRRVVESHLKQGISLVFAIPDHPWVDSVDGATVRIAMAVGIKGQRGGTLLQVIDEQTEQDGSSNVTFSIRVGQIHADLTIGVSTSGILALQSNLQLSTPGVKLHGAGFIVSPQEAKTLGLGKIAGLEQHIRDYRHGRDLTDKPRGVMVIDLDGLKIDEVIDRFPAVYQRLVERVKPERDTNNQKYRRENWWLFGGKNTRLRNVLVGLSRYIATAETSKHRFFQFLSKDILPDNMLIAIAFEEAFFLGVLSSRIHICWALAAGGTLEDRPRYNKTRCFDPFPFPAPTDAQCTRIRELGEQLDAHRKRQQAAHPELTMTGMYNVLEKIRAGEPLNDKEKKIHEQGLVSVLKKIHDDLDAAVFDAYGWPHDLTDEQILERLVKLNAERAEEERNGLIRWLRPEFQNPSGQKAATTQVAIEKEDESEDDVVVTTKLEAWPKKLSEQIKKVRDQMCKTQHAWSMKQVLSCFKSAKAKEVEAVLESLTALGMLVEYRAGDERRWRSSQNAA